MSVAVTGFLLLFAAVISIHVGKGVEPKCAVIAKKNYEIAFHLSGHFFKEKFTGEAIYLVNPYNEWLRNTSGTFQSRAARLLLGYEDEVFVLPYSLGKFEHEEGFIRAVFTPARSDLNVEIKSWFRGNRNGETQGVENYADFGILDPATVTFFLDIIFAGDKRFGTTNIGAPVDIDHRINYTAGNHFDLTNETSIVGERGSKTLIGVVDGNKIYRQNCDHNSGRLTYQIIDDLPHSLITTGETNCFSIDECVMAIGDRNFFNDILVIPKEKIRKPTLPLIKTTTTSTPTITATSKASAEVNEEVSAMTFETKKNEENGDGGKEAAKGEGKETDGTGRKRAGWWLIAVVTVVCQLGRMLL
ncbi:hypothetical protein L596_017477 [Steinernema carpocapsae]|uniref:Uncharacterized protein n=1 Tax=Steinernema carpocapsae TaxID=34508 RepID=A0A4U5N2J3_STECR|nr:hypothetical protein L596_017477 [Steinernema carpocapsae]